MPDVQPAAVVVAAVAAFASGGAYYALLGERLARLSDAAVAGRPSSWTLAVESARCLVLAAVVAGLAAQGEIDAWIGGAILGLALWIGFPLVLWTGAVVHEGVPWRLAAIHGGDWLVKLVLVAVIVAAWP